MVELTEHAGLSRETIRRRLHENELKPWQRKMWCIAKVDAEYVARMEDVLDLYATEPKANHPVVSFDESPVQPIGEVRAALAAVPGQAERYDSEYPGLSSFSRSVLSALPPIPMSMLTPTQLALVYVKRVFCGHSERSSTLHVPLNGEAMRVLESWREQSGDGPRVFEISTGFKTAWGHILKRANIVVFRWHDLRHHFASRLVQLGVPLNTVRDLLGHSSIAMSLRYAHLAPDQRREAVAMLNQRPILALTVRLPPNAKVERPLVTF